VSVLDASTRQALEAILFVVDEPVDLSTLCQVLEVGRDDLEAALLELAEEYHRDQRGFVLREIAGGWRLYTAPDAAEYVERWVLAGRTGRLSQAALETLAVVAYKQPISRQEVSDVRGVNADAALRTLLARGLAEEVGRDPGPGQAILYGTTDLLLEKLGLDSIDDLPPLTDYLGEGEAPDEPRPVDLRTARQRLRSGQGLPSTGRGRWDPDDDTSGAAVDPAVDGTEDGEVARLGREREMDGLSDALEDAARNAMATLEEAIRTVSEVAGGGEGGDDDGDAADR
jgi:segregation and condensation protein B